MIVILASIFLSLTLFVSRMALAEDLIRIQTQESQADRRQQYPIQLLELVLKKTSKDYGDFKLIPQPIEMSGSRLMLELERNRTVDLIWLPTSNELETKLLPIRIPIIKDILGYRLLLIKGNNSKRYENIRNLKDLQQFTIGQGHDWGDVKILEANGIKVVKSSSYEGLFQMLMTERFDFFSRGITEIFDEYASRHNQLAGLTIEQNLVLYYPYVNYFFVNKQNHRLARRIEAGLIRMIADGSFDRSFEAYYKVSVERANLKNRQVIKLRNPFLPPKTPLNDESLWYKP
ncbi:MAG TPA: hypothetical protein VE954_10340 [Oligoflexus sp.]|uniref:hypothetical protein n=1 Tax=Oligoflexus sp. TaxID=1971216 RepID=UPI002D3B5E27|nr:hypothetical protein [Oligoflexus sp.]HYX33502.1 hypothetical protein [Oligoflexus sp.]